MDTQKVLNVIRYFLFIPLAFIASIIAGAIGNFLGDFGIWIYEGSEILGWIISGVFSALAFIHIAMLISPAKTNRIKWIVLGAITLLGALSFVGGAFFSDTLSFIAGLSMIATAALFAKLKANEIF